MIIEQDISELIVGSYIIEITKQNNGYNLANNGWVKSYSVIEQLKNKGVQRVLVDINKERNYGTNVSLAQKESSPLTDNLIHAKEIFNQSKEIQARLLNDARTGVRLDLAPVVEITNKSVEDIFNNPDALACIINIRIKDEYLLEHSIAVSILIAIFSNYLDIDINTAKELSIGAFLHDIGKAKIPDHILNKPGKLTTDEFTIMKSHVAHSTHLIKSMKGLSALSLEIAALHHEKLDGSGYPKKVKAEEISIYGRMITICDIFDALTSTRCYKKGFSQVKAFSILRTLAADGQLDPGLVDSFIKCMGVYPIGSIVKLKSNKLAIVE